MIPKDNVSVIGLKIGEGRKFFSVAGYKTLGFYPASKKRRYHDYQRALEYSLKLRDYYQVDVVEY